MLKRVSALAILVALLLSCLSLLTMTAVADDDAASDDYTVKVSDQIGLTAKETETTGQPVCYLDGTLAADAAMPYTFSCLVKVDNGGTDPLRYYTAEIDGEEHPEVVTATYNAGSNSSTVFLKLEEGRYGNVRVRASDGKGHSYDVLMFGYLTVTAPEHSVSDDGWNISTTPCFTLTPSDLTYGTSVNAVTVTENDDGYATFSCSEKGDPYLSYISNSETVVGRYLLIKYNNHSTIPRMQIYMAQAAGIASDTNMIEFEIAANGSGWTYVIVDLSNNAFYNKDTQALFYFRFDPLEARNWSDGAYKFSGQESIDVAYIKGFSTLAGAQGYLETKELHDVTKTATLQSSQLTQGEDGYTYTDKNGDVYPVTANEDGTYSYTFSARDVRVPVKAVPTLVLDGSKLLGTQANHVSAVKDPTTGVVTLTVDAADPHYQVISTQTKVARFMAIRYKTTVGDQMEFFLSSTDAAPAGGQSFKCPMTSDGAWHTMVVDLAGVDVSTLDKETYLLNFLRWDVFDTAAEGVMEVEYIAFFDVEDAAYLYEHVYKTYTVSFLANNKIVAKVPFEPGETSVQEPEVPAKEGYTGVWEAYTLTDKNLTVKAIYTAIPKPVETDDETETTTEVETQPDTTEEVTTPEIQETETVTTEAPVTETTEPETQEETLGTSEETTTEASSETQAPVDETTQPGTETTQAAATTEAAGTNGEDEGGCSSVMGGSTVILLLAGAVGMAIRKKKDE